MNNSQEYKNLVIFDLDGVLIWSRDLHYKALNTALKSIDSKYVISMEDHLSTYDGLPTRVKLDLLSRQKGFPIDKVDEVYEAKQAATIDLISRMGENKDLIRIFRYLKSKGFMIAVASNAVRDTVKIALVRLGLIELVDYFQSNQDVSISKPYPRMFWNCMEACYAIPSTSIIVEDSHIGRQGAIDSGATLLAVEDPSDLTFDKIEKAVERLLNSERENIPWRDNKLNVLIPMAGAGSRFAQQGYTFPKPLIEINHKPMIQIVAENLNIDANYIFIVQQEHYDKYNLKYLLNLIKPGCKIVCVSDLTEGAACTTLLAKDLIDNDCPLVIANSDQFIEWNSNEAMYAFTADGVDGGILTFKATHPKWSFAKIGDNGFVDEVAEKKPISDNATVGVYYWRKGSDYVKYAEQMIRKDIRTNGEFYVAPVFNEAIGANKKIRVKEIGQMWGIGTPEDLNYFLEHYEGKL